jgi:hypothetical protein
MPTDKMTSVLRIALRVAAGTLVYAGIVAAATVLPAAAGLMLTFPAINGLAFFFSGDAKAASMARTMLWMPVVNGALCALYMLVLLALGTRSSTALAGWLLLFLVVALWYACASGKTVMEGIAPQYQLAYSVAAALIGAVFVVITVASSARPGAVPHEAYAAGPENWGWVIDAMLRSKLKIVLFAVALAAFIVAEAYFPISDAARGVLAGLPIVPFGGLVSIAGDPGTGAAERIHIIRGMMTSMWLAPAVGIWFIYSISMLFSTRRKLAVGWRNEAARFAAVVLGWTACFLIIIAISAAIDAFGAP